MAERMVTAATPFLQVPPFPGSQPSSFAGEARGPLKDAELDEAIDAIAAARVGGTYWGARPPLPATPYTLVHLRDAADRAHVLSDLPAHRTVLCWNAKPVRQLVGEQRIEWISGICDPWHLVEGAVEVFADADGEVAIVAAMAGKWTTGFGPDSDVLDSSRAALRDVMRRHPAMNFGYVSPFTQELIDLPGAIALCAFWRNLIDSNRPIVAAFGFAAWKRPTVAPLLWAGSGDVAFMSSAANIRAGDQVAMWKSRVSPPTLASLQRREAQLIEVEDGFIRSVGLGAECVPPLSIVVDRLGAYFDPSGPSELERLIENARFDGTMLERASALRALIVEEGVSKYGAGHAVLARRSGNQRHILVAGQVEDDRSVMCGGGEVRTNLELLQRVRDAAPDAFITYKPHPDVEAGHRIGAIPVKIALKLANEIVSDQPISALIELVDEVHVNTSLAGFEALLRGRAVTTHGVPFYAGWGLTRDLGAIPVRRTARRTLDELVTAVLLVYPRYLDPKTGLPCPPEILVRSLADAAGIGGQGLLVSLRRLQGMLMRGLVSLREGRRA